MNLNISLTLIANLDGPLEVGCFLPSDSYDSTNAAFSAGTLTHHACVVKCNEDGHRIAVLFNVISII